MCRTFQEMIEWFDSLKVINTKGKNITAQIKWYQEVGDYSSCNKPAVETLK
jgi:hypothetical protein